MEAAEPVTRFERLDRVIETNNMEGFWNMNIPLNSERSKGNQNQKMSKKGKRKGLDHCHSNHKKTSDSETLNLQKTLRKNKMKVGLSKTYKQASISKAPKLHKVNHKIYFPLNTITLHNPLNSKPNHQIFSKWISLLLNYKTNYSPRAYLKT